MLVQTAVLSVGLTAAQCTKVISLADVNHVRLEQIGELSMFDEIKQTLEQGDCKQLLRQVLEEFDKAGATDETDSVFFHRYQRIIDELRKLAEER